MIQLIECVPNFSEGRDLATINAIAESIESVEGVYLLHVDSGFDPNRTVMTFVGEPDAVIEAAFRAVSTASQLIDMRKHSGVHRRLGAIDVFPFVPFKNITMEECARHARSLSARIAEELGIPIYLYGKASNRIERQKLPDIRRGEYELLAAKLQDPNFAPDFGDPVFHPTAGAAVIGARDFMLAYNVNLNTKDVAVAKSIARELRESGKIKRDDEGQPIKGESGEYIKIPGSLAACQGDGWYIEEFGMSQVTMNLLDIEKTGLHTAFEAVKKEAAAFGVEVRGSELIGMCPKRSLIAAGQFYSENDGTIIEEERLIEIAVKELGLDYLKPFIIEERVLEYAVSARMGEKSEV